MRRLVIKILSALSIALFLPQASNAQNTISTFAGGGTQSGPAVSAALAEPFSVARDKSGNLFISATFESQVFKVDASGGLTVFAGNGIVGFSGDGGPATSASLNFPTGVALDVSGNLFIADASNNRIRRVDAATSIITTVAGSGTPGFSGDGGPATSASLGFARGVALDGSGNIFIADTSNNRIRRVDVATGIINTVAGNGIFGFSGDAGLATAASLNFPAGIAADGSGNLFIADEGNRRIRRVDAATGIITTVAGNGIPTFSGDGGLATAASLSAPFGVAVDGSGNILIADTGNARVRRVAAATGIISTVAGNGTAAFSGDSGPATSASLSFPTGITIDASGNLFIADLGNNRVRTVAPTTGIITTIAGGGSGGDGGPATSAVLAVPLGLARASGKVFIADQGISRVRQVDTATGTITTVAGNGTFNVGGDGGAATSASIDGPEGVAVDGLGNLFIAEFGNRVRRVDAATGIITTVAGGGSGGDGSLATSASLNFPNGLAVDASGNLFIADTSNNRIRKVDAVTGIITTVAGNATAGFSGDGGLATAASLNFPFGVAVDKSGNLFIADSNNQRIRRVDAATSIITTVAGEGFAGFFGDGGAATIAGLSSPRGIALDGSGNLFIADAGNQRVRRVDASTGVINTVAGNGIGGFSGDGGPATDASLNGPFSVTVDAAGGMFIADSGNNRIRFFQLPPSISLSSTSFTFSGTGVGFTSAAQTVTLKNLGPGKLTLSISTSGDFAETNNCGSSLALGGSCTINVTFTPTFPGTNFGAVLVSSNAIGSPQVVSLTGTGLPAPADTFSTATTINFGNQVVGTTSGPRTVVLTNSPAGVTFLSGFSTGGITVTSVTPDSGPTTGGTVVTITGTGFQTGATVFFDQTTSLIVPATAVTVVSSTQIQAVTPPGPAGFVLNVFVTNPGGQTAGLFRAFFYTTGTATFSLTITSIVISGDFAQTNNCPTSPATLAALGSCQISITFTPTAVGARPGALTIADNAPGSPHVFNLTGAGIASSGPTTCPTTIAAIRNYGKLPLAFAANRGQTDEQVKFVSRGRGYALFLTPGEAVLALGRPGQKSRRGESPAATKAGSARPGELSASAAFSELLGSEAGSKVAQTRRGESAAFSDVLRFGLVGANATPHVSGLEELPGKSNYFVGNDPEKWRRDIPTYARVKYQDVYPGVDLVYYGDQRQLEYDFVVAPGADPKAIRLNIDTRNSKLETYKSKITIDASGDLIIETGGGEVRLHKPVVYQTVNSANPSFNSEFRIHNSEFLDGHYVLLAENRIGFEVSGYDPTQPLVIDPVLSYSTYLGGSFEDLGVRIAVDSACNAYVAGITESTDFPTTSGAARTALPVSTLCHNGTRPCGDAFVTKLNPTGTALVYSTYLGGSREDFGTAIAVDASGSAYIVGNTSSTDFPTTAGAFQSTLKNLGHGDDAFVAKLSAAGDALVYSTYLGGSHGDAAIGIAVDGSGNAYVTGGTGSSDFPTTAGAFQATSPNVTCVNPSGRIDNCRHAFVTKLNSTGSALAFSTFLGGTNNDMAASIGIDAAGSAYVTGVTFSTDFPTVNAFKATTSGGTCTPANGHPCTDGFVSKLKPDGSGLVYSTYLGGSADDAGIGIAVDSAGSAYVAGVTNSKDFPTTAGAVQTAFGGGVCFPAQKTFQAFDCPDAFLTKFDPTGKTLTYSTYLGGTSIDAGTAVAVDASGNAYVTGATISPDFPLASPVQSKYQGGFCSFDQHQRNVPFPCPDAFVTKVNSAGSALIFSSYLGGSAEDLGLGIALDSFGNAYVVGVTGSSDFPTTAGAFQTVIGGKHDAFVARVTNLRLPVVSLSSTKLSFADLGFGFTSAAQAVTLTNLGDAALTIASIGATGNFAQTNTCGTSVTAGGNCTISITFTPTATGSRTGSVTITDNAFGNPRTISLAGNGLAAPSVSLSQTSLSFAEQVLGTSSAAQTVTLSNTGIAPLTITSLVASGDFGQTNTCGTSVAAGANCAMNVTFKPTATGSRTGAVTITDDASGSPQTIALTGTAVQPTVSLSATSLTFLDTHLNSTCERVGTVTVTNTGTGTLVISSVTVSGDFKLINACDPTVAPGASCNVITKFVPTAIGTRTGTVTITDNAPGSSQTVALSGNGLAECVIVTTIAKTAAVVRGTDATALGVSDAKPCQHPATVTFACSGEAPAKCLFDPASIEPTGTTRLTVSNLRALQPDSLTFDVVGTAPRVPGVSGTRESHLQVTVLISDFSFITYPPSATIVAGQSASYAVSVLPQNRLSGTVSLDCSGAPAGATCSVSPASVTLDGVTPVQAKITVQTAARAQMAPGPGSPVGLPPLARPLGQPWAAALVILAALGAMLLAARRRRLWLAMAVSILLVLFWAACGGGGSFVPSSRPAGTAPGTYSLTITGTYSSAQGASSAQLSHSTTLSLTVN